MRWPWGILPLGKELVHSVYEFKHENGLWPLSLDEVSVRYDKSKKLGGWRYVWRGNGSPYLINYFDFPRAALKYDFHIKNSGWKLTNGVDEGRLKIVQPKYKPKVKYSSETILKRKEKLLLARISDNPKSIIHHKGLISLLFKEKKYRRAKKACEKCLAVWPDHWWPNLLHALIERESDPLGESEKRLRRCALKHKDFNHWFFLAYFYTSAKQHEKLDGVLRKMGKLDLKDVDSYFEETQESLGIRAAAMGLQATMLAYRSGKYEASIAICNRWEKYWRDNYTAADASFFALRAACLLRLNKLKEAKKDIEAAIAISRERRMWARNLAELRRAIENGKSDYVYDPRIGKKHFEIVQYE